MAKRHVEPKDADQAEDHGRRAKEDPTQEDLAELLAKVTEERDSLRDQLLRTMADMQNFRKRTMAEKAQLQQFANEQLVRELLPVLDNFERTLAAVERGATIESLVEGVKMVDRQLRTVLESKQVTRIDASGAVFDPDLHEAIATYATDELPEGTITGEIEAGYKMSDRVIRPAKVQVAKKP